MNKKNMTKRQIKKNKLGCETCLKGRPLFNSKYKSVSRSAVKRLRKTICRIYPNRDAVFKSLGYELKDDSLLSVEGKVPGEIIPLSEITTESLVNTPGIYAFRCIITNNHFVGETKNIKHKIATYRTNLLCNRHSNKEFQEEFDKYGIENFELILYETGSTCDDSIYRSFIEYKLQSELSAEGNCYNKGLSERLRLNVQPQGKTSEPGVYIIRCKINNACLFGETGQRRGLSGRLNRWKSNLRQNQAKNQILQHDFLFYGEDAFEFLIAEKGSQWTDARTRRKRESELYRAHRDAGGICYNTFDPISRRRAPSCPLAARDTILYNKSQEFRDYISRLNTGRISEYRKPVVAEGNVYFSVAEAAEFLNVTRRVIRSKLATGAYSLANSDQVESEKTRRENSETGASGIRVDKPKRTSGFPVKVEIDGVVYDSESEAARAKSVSPQAISRSLRKGRKGYYKLDSEGFKLDNNGNRIQT